MIGRPQQVCMMGLDIRNGICRSTPLLFITAASCRVTEELRVLHTLSGKVLKTRKRISGSLCKSRLQASGTAWPAQPQFLLQATAGDFSDWAATPTPLRPGCTRRAASILGIIHGLDMHTIAQGPAKATQKASANYVGVWPWMFSAA